jgi:hypothetical protein
MLSLSFGLLTQAAVYARLACVSVCLAGWRDPLCRTVDQKREETLVMASAHVIEVGEIAAGIVILEQGGFRFFASDRAFRSLEGALFRTIDQATRTACKCLQPANRIGARMAVRAAKPVSAFRLAERHDRD